MIRRCLRQKPEDEARLDLDALTGCVVLPIPHCTADPKIVSVDGGRDQRLRSHIVHTLAMVLCS